MFCSKFSVRPLSALFDLSTISSDLSGKSLLRTYKLHSRTYRSETRLFKSDGGVRALFGFRPLTLNDAQATDWLLYRYTMIMQQSVLA